MTKTVDRPADIQIAGDIRIARPVRTRGRVDDGLAAARGLVFGLAGALICWLMIGVVIWIALS